MGEESNVVQLPQERRKPLTVEDHLARARSSLEFFRSLSGAPPHHAELSEAELVILNAAVYISVDHTFPAELSGSGSQSEAEAIAAWARVKTDPRWVVWEALGTAAGNAMDSRTPEELAALDEEDAL